MKMKKTINDATEMYEEFKACGRENQFSFKAINVLFDYLNDMYDTIDEDYELDVIELCCNFTEYENFEEFKKENEDIETIDDLIDFAVVLMIDNESFIIENF